MHILGGLLILAGIAIYFLTPEERTRILGLLLTWWRTQKDEWLRRWKARGQEPDGSEEERPHVPLPLLTAAIVLVNAFIFVEMLLGEGALRDESTLVAWGANFGPETTNGGWWRLATSLFVHTGFLQFLAGLCGFIQLGIIVERLVGRLAFATVYVVAGIFAGLVSLSTFPIVPIAGSTAAIFGIYGLFLAVWIWSVIQRTPITIPLNTLKRMALPIGFFLLYTSVGGPMGAPAHLAGFIIGFTSGLVFAIGAEERKPAVPRVAVLTAVTLVLAVVFAVPLRGLSDVRPEVARIVALEQQTAGAYDAAVKRFTGGNLDTKALAKVIDGTIAPELRDASARLAAFERVPPEHTLLVKAAGQYLKLRAESWRVRSDALRRSNMRGLQKADRLEWESLEAYDALKRMAAK